MIGNSNGDFREPSRGSVALKGITRAGVTVIEAIQEKAVVDDPVPEMAACQTDMLTLYHCVPSVHEHPYTYRRTF